MKFKIKPEIFQKWPKVKIGAVVALGVKNTGSKEILQLLREQEQKTQAEFAGVQISQVPEVAVWRITYKEFGCSGNKYVSSVEALLKRVSKGNQLPDINPLVNLYNYLSLKYKMPFGGEDLDKVKGEIILKICDGTESGIYIGSTEPETCESGEVAYCDDLGFICRRWNWREADRSKLDEKTQKVILVTETMPPVTEENLKSAIKEMENLVQQYLGGEIKTVILDKDNQEYELY